MDRINELIKSPYVTLIVDRNDICSFDPDLANHIYLNPYTAECDLTEGLQKITEEHTTEMYYVMIDDASTSSNLVTYSDLSATSEEGKQRTTQINRNWLVERVKLTQKTSVQLNKI